MTTTVRWILKSFILLVLLATVFLPTFSSDYFVMRLEALVRGATAIVEAEVVDIKSSKDAHNAPIDVVSLKILKNIAGEMTAPSLILELPKVDHDTGTNSIVPRFTQKERSIIFLKRLPEGVYIVLGHDRGKVEIAGETIKGTQVTVGQFELAIKDLLSGRSAKIDFRGLQKVTTDSAGDSGGKGLSKLGGQFHLLNPGGYGPSSGTTLELRINPANAVDPSGNALSFNDIKAAVQRAVDSWNNVNCSYATLSVSGSPTNDSRTVGNGVSTITFEQSGNLYGSNGADWNSYSNGIITEVDLAFNLANRWNTDVNYPSSYYTYTHPVWGTIGPVDLEDVVAHELGHAVGLDHVGSSYDLNTMYGTVYTDTYWWEKTWRRSLEPGDKSGKAYQDPASSVSLSGSLPFSLLIGRPQSVNIAVSVGDDLTIPAGRTITFENGGVATFSFNGDYMLHVEGTLVVGNGATSTTTFTRSGGRWHGIEFYYGGSGSSLDHAIIENADFGLSLFGTSPSISNCTIQNNGTGVYASSTYSTFIWTLFDNNTKGFELASYGDPTISHSVLRYNSYAVYGDATSVPTMGGTSGSNSFNYTDYYDVYTEYAGTINAQSNWWYPWSPSFYGNVDYSNYLGSDPNTWAGKMVAPPRRAVLPPVLAKKGVVTTDSPGMNELEEGYHLMLYGGQEQALNKFRSVIAKYPDSFAGERSLAFSDHILEKSGLDAQQNLLSVIAQSPNSGVGVLAKSLLTSHLVKEGRYKDAFDNVVALAENPNKTISKRALFDAGSIAWYRQADKATGEKYLRTLIAGFPGDPLSLSAMCTLGESAGKPLEHQAIGETGWIEKVFGLQNYPNPFNPSTHICFSVRQNGQTTLRVFNLLGQMVATLYDGQAESGKLYDVIFDASRLPSGTYLSRLESNGESASKKLVFVK